MRLSVQAHGDQLNMTLISATWSYSPGPGRGVDNWYSVQANIADVRMCVTQFQSPAPPPPPATPPPGAGRRLSVVEGNATALEDDRRPVPLDSMMWSRPSWRHVDAWAPSEKK